MQSIEFPPIGRRLVIGLVALFMVLAVVIPAVRRRELLNVYVDAASRMIAGEEIYRRSLGGDAFIYPPFFTLPFLPFTSLPPSVHRNVWWFCNLSLCSLAVGLSTVLAWPVIRRGIASGGPPYWCCALAVGILCAKFLIQPLTYESHDLIVLLLVLLAALALAMERDGQAGFWGGLATACKATPLLLLPYLVWQRKLSASVIFILTVVVATLLPDVLFPHPSGGLWIQSWYEHFVSKVAMGDSIVWTEVHKEWNSLNQSLAATLHRLFTPVETEGDVINIAIVPLTRNSIRWITLTLDLAIGSWFAWITWHGRLEAVDPADRSFARLGQFGAVLSCMLLLSPGSSTYHFCFLYVPISFCAVTWFYCGRSPIVGAVLVVQFVISLASAQDLVGAWLSDRLLAYGIKTADALLLLACTGYILVWELPRRAACDGDSRAAAAPTIAIPMRRVAGRRAA